MWIQFLILGFGWGFGLAEIASLLHLAAIEGLLLPTHLEILVLKIALLGKHSLRHC